MELHCVFADPEASGYVAIRQAVGHQHEHVELTSGQQFHQRIVITPGRRQREHGLSLLDEIDDLEMRIGPELRAQRSGGSSKVNA